MYFIVVRQSGKYSGFVIFHLKYIAFTKVKKDANLKNWYVKGIPFVIVRYMKGGPFLSKRTSKREKGWTSGRSLHVKKFGFFFPGKNLSM